jgi:hypothetical protein
MFILKDNVCVEQDLVNDQNEAVPNDSQEEWHWEWIFNTFFILDICIRFDLLGHDVH